MLIEFVFDPYFCSFLQSDLILNNNFPYVAYPNLIP